MNVINSRDIRKIIREFIIDNFKIENEKGLLDEMSFLEEGIIDSIGVLELVAFLESTFQFRVEDEELIPDNLDSVEKLIDFVIVKSSKH